MRKEITVTFEDRGNELKFKIKEMSAISLEKWIIKAGLILADCGLLQMPVDSTNSPDEIANSAMKAIAHDGLSLLGKIDFKKAEPLYDDLLKCCKYINGNAEMDCNTDLLEGVIEDVRTLFKLRMEALKINFSFFTEGGKSENLPSEPSIRIIRTKKNS